MTSLAMFFSFIMLLVGGYGFSSTKVASLNIPLMEKIAPTVHSWAFLNPLGCGLILFAYAVFSVSKNHSFKALQIALALLLILVLVDAMSIYQAITAFSYGGRPSLETLLMAESGIGAAIFCLFGFRKLQKLQKTLPDSKKPVEVSGVHEM